MKRVISFVYVLLLTALFSTAFASDSIMVYDAWVRSAPPNAKVIAAYMKIMNKSNETRALTMISSSRFNRVEMHKTEIHEGMMKMIPQKDLQILSGETVTLEPGGYHLMLMEPKSMPKEGEQVDMELRFDNGKTLQVSVPVRDEGAHGIAGEHRH